MEMHIKPAISFGVLEYQNSLLTHLCKCTMKYSQSNRKAAIYFAIWLFHSKA